MAAELISKTSFLKFEQCSKAFYFYKRLPHLVEQPDANRKQLFLRGHQVGLFGRDLFPGGTDASKDAPDAATIVENTRKLLENGVAVIYEAGIVFQNTLVIVDILRRDADGWWAYEIKSGMKISGNYLKDANLQYYVLKNLFPQFRDLFLVTVNPEYVLNGSPDPKKYFVRRSMKKQAEKNFDYFGARLNEANLVLEKDVVPDVPVGAHCFKPYRCDFFGTCWKTDEQPMSIFNLPTADNRSLLEWHNAGITEMGDIPDELITKSSLVKIREATLSGKPFIDGEKINAFLTRVKTPVVAMDMEIWTPPIPRLQKTRPFEPIPFLVSLYDGSTFTNSFHDNVIDERAVFAEALINLTAPFETILVYDSSLELSMLRHLRRACPHLSAPLQLISEKIVDVFDVFLRLWYYHPAFKNNFSLKTISAALLNDVAYNGIESGLEAMKLYADYYDSSNALEKETLKVALIDYCNTDTLATFRLYEFLQQTALLPNPGK